MRIFIDGDACNVTKIIEEIASKNGIECHIYCNTTQQLESDYSEIHIVDKSPDSVDFAIINACTEKDIVITNDSGLAAIVLSKKGIALNTHGLQYTNKNIMSFLNRRYIRRDAKRKTKRDQVSGFKLCDHAKEYTPFPVSLSRLIRKYS